MEETLTSQLRKELVALLGPRRFHMGDRERLGTALPRSPAEVQRILLLTRDARVPIYARAAGTSSYRLAGPDEGLTVSFDEMRQIRGVNTRSRLITVQPGVIWHTLIEHLATRGLMLRVYPSSEGFSTVGGFVAQGGAGIGSYQFGDIGHNVAALRLVDANGELRHVKGDDLRLVVGAEGRTGLVVEITLRLQALAAMTPVVALFDSFEQAESCLAEEIGQALPIWSINLMGPIGSGVQSRSWPEMALPEGAHPVIFSFRQSDAAAVLPALRAGILDGGGRLIDVQGDNEDWLVQFASLQAQGTTPVPMQFQIPFGRAAEFDASIPAKLRRRLALEAVLTDGGKFVVVRLFFADRSASVEDNRLAAQDLLALAKKVGGSSYAAGAVYPEEAAAVFGPERLKAMADFRRIVDPDNRLNPGHGLN
jgi:FAD/FMN-containing dehydrogenase